ncbi:MAG: transcription elongation factor GreA [Pirellulaceae bacterium]|nr:transcription elongation factor GreA [Planctomycetaceae bacterium]
MSNLIPMTRTAYNRKKKEADRMDNEEIPLIAEKIGEARAEGDLKENAEYHAQREAYAHLQARIGKIRSDLANAMIIDPSTVPRDEVAFGATVTVKDLDYDDEEDFTLVGSGDEDYDVGKILITSPIGKGLLGKKIGEKAEIEVPKGKLHFEILNIAYDFEEEEE